MMDVRDLHTWADVRPVGGFDVILADPPWHFSSNSAAKPGKNAMAHYRTMKIPELCAIPVKHMVADDALLLMWVTAPLADQAFKVVRAWGFRYVSQLVWVKNTLGTGYWARNRHELVYICRRGRFPCERPAPFADSVIEAATRGHSRKPDALHLAVEARWPETRRLEMFARQTRPGWAVIGNETTKFNEGARA